MTRIRYLVKTMSLAILMVGCSPSQSPNAPIAPSEGQAADPCPQISVVGTNGHPVDLNGQWRATDFGEYYVSQRQSCVHWLALSPSVDADTPPGSRWTNVYVGHINSDFTIDGEFSDVPYRYDVPRENAGELVLKISYFDRDGTTWPALHLEDLRWAQGYGGTDWVPEESLPAKQTYEGTYGWDATAHCPWIEIEGTRYELAEWQYLTSAEGHLIGDREQIVGRPGAHLRIEGQVWPAPIPNSCQSATVMAWDVDVLP